MAFYTVNSDYHDIPLISVYNKTEVNALHNTILHSKKRTVRLFQF